MDIDFYKGQRVAFVWLNTYFYGTIDKILNKEYVKIKLDDQTIITRNIENHEVLPYSGYEFVVYKPKKGEI